MSLPAGLLREGDNVIAVQAHNSSLTSSTDFYFDAELVSVRGPTNRGPTPGRINAAFSPVAPPAVRQVNHEPAEPRTGSSVVIRARVTDPDGVASVTLAYQVVEPGAYIEITDPEYETAWTTLPMRDDGQAGDTTAGDNLYTAVVPREVQVHRRLVRYRIIAVDQTGQEVRAPYPDDPCPNFAYFVYDGVPAWSGAVRPGVSTADGQVFTVPEEEMNRLPALHFIAKRRAVEESTWFSRYGGNAYPWKGTLAFRGKVYDHIRHRARGGVWRYAMVKNMWKFDLNRGHDFEAYDNWGRPWPVRWSKLNLGACIQQADHGHRGEQGMFESVGFRVFQLAGVPAMNSAFVQLRIIDEAQEASAEDQYEGDFWGLYLMLEQPNGRFLDQHGLPDGNLFKMEGGGGELNNVGHSGPADGRDLNAFLRDYNNASEEWWRSNLDVSMYLSYQTVVQAIHHYDICADKNFFYFHNPDLGKWQVFPWDLDLTWAENMYDAGCGGQDRIKQRLLPDSEQFPAVWRDWQNRIREFRDLFWNEDEAIRLIDEYAGRLRGPATGPTILDADRAQWDYNPRMADPAYTFSPNGKARRGRYYRWSYYPAGEISRDFTGAVQLMKRYVGFRATNIAANPQPLDAIAADPLIPATPRIQYAGTSGFPVDGLKFSVSEYDGSAPFAALRWRIGEITRPDAPSWMATEPWKYEIEPVWESGPITLFAPEIRIPPRALTTGRVYRARAQFQDSEGRTSHWSEPIEFVAGAAAGTGPVADSLRITELMYNSADGAVNDFIEFFNAGSSTLQLGGIEFTEGISFVFPANAALEPGEYALLVRASPVNDFQAFRDLYGLGPELKIFGPYDANFSDDGERIAMSAPGGAPELLSITYSDGRGWPIAADGGGHSIVPRADFGSASSGALDYGPNWRASTFVRGSPGSADPEPTHTIVINEVVAHTDLAGDDSNDWIELHNPAATPFVFDAGWYLSDDEDDLRKWQIPEGTQIPAGGFISFDEKTGFNNPPGSGFGLSKSGEEVYLSYFPPDARGGVVDAMTFEAQPNGGSVGRLPDGAPYWDQLVPPTRNAPNSGVAPRLVLSEILYHDGGLPPSDLPPEFLEYVEIHNPTSTAVPLFNTNAVWRLSGGLDYQMPTFITLAPDERLVVVGFDPVLNPATLAAFREYFGVPAATRVIGPFTGRLDNDADRIALESAQAPDAPGELIAWYIVDEVYYHDRAPWPEGANGQGRSLHRTLADRPGTDPGSWIDGPPSPGRPPTDDGGDQDRDGMPDEWETAHGLDPEDPADALEDADDDGLLNRDEFLAGTDPRDAQSLLRLHELRLAAPSVIEFTFSAAANRSYVVESSATGLPGSWAEVRTIAEEPAARDVTVSIPIPSEASASFYRVRIP